VLYDASPGIEGKVDIWHLEAGSTTVYLTAVAKSWRDAFGIEVELHVLGWADYLQRRNDRTLNGPFPLGWAMDYASAENFLTPLYGEGPGEENYGYLDDGLNTLMAAAASATTVGAGLELYTQAEQLILEDMPVIPITFGRTVGGYSERVADVSLDPYDRLDFTKVTISS